MFPGVVPQQHTWGLLPPQPQQQLYPQSTSSSPLMNTPPSMMAMTTTPSQPTMSSYVLQNRDIPQRNAALASPVQHPKELLELLAKVGIMPEQALYLTRVRCERYLYERGLLPLSSSMYYVKLSGQGQPPQPQPPQHQPQQHQHLAYPPQSPPSYTAGYPFSHPPQPPSFSVSTSSSSSSSSSSLSPGSSTVYPYFLQQEMEQLKTSSIDPQGDALILQMRLSYQQFLHTHCKIGEIIRALEHVQSQGLIIQQQAHKFDLKDHMTALAHHSSIFYGLLQQYIQFVSQSKESCVNLSQLGQHTRHFFNQVQQHRIRCGMELSQVLQHINHVQDETMFRLSPNITSLMMTTMS